MEKCGDGTAMPFCCVLAVFISEVLYGNTAECQSILVVSGKVAVHINCGKRRLSSAASEEGIAPDGHGISVS